MSFTIQIIGVAAGDETPAAGLYVQSFEADAHRGRGDLVLTNARERARRFATAGAALECWRAQCPPPYHLRSDGKPNRPMTAFTVKVEQVTE